MATAHETRNPIEQTTTGARRCRVSEEVKEQVRRCAARRDIQGFSWEAIDGETRLEARKAQAWYRKEREVTLVPAQRDRERSSGLH